MKCSCQAVNMTDTTIALCLGLELLPVLLCVRKYCRMLYWRLFVLSGHRKEAGGVLRAVGKPLPRVCWQNHRNGSVPIYHGCWTGQYRVIVIFSPFTVADIMLSVPRHVSKSSNVVYWFENKRSKHIKDSKERLFIMTQTHNLHIFRVIPTLCLSSFLLHS